MSALAQVFEAEGLATVGISLVRGQAERARPPRMLHCDFPLGRPLGVPGDADFQHRVLKMALALLSRNDVPVLVDFDETLSDEADTPLSCALPPRSDAGLHPAIDEALGLRPAYERQRVASGRTNVVRLGGPDRIASLLSTFVEIAAGTPWDSLVTEPAQLGHAALDVRAYYEEAGLALADHVPAARQTESWFYQKTRSGRLLRETQQLLRDADAPRSAWFLLVPAGQPTI